MGTLEKYHAEGIYPSRSIDHETIGSEVENYIRGMALRFYKEVDGTMTIVDCAGFDYVVHSRAEAIKMANEFADGWIDVFNFGVLFTLSNPRAQVHKELKRQLRCLLISKWEKCRELGYCQPAVQSKSALDLITR
jgi:hypothetical protein